MPRKRKADQKNIPDDEKTWRLNRQDWAVTWKHANAIGSKENLLKFVQNIVGKMIYYIIAEEKHADGDIHYHAYFDFGRKVDYADVHKTFNINGCKPHDSDDKPRTTSKAGRQGWIEYCMFGQNYICSGKYEMFYTSKNFKKRKADFDLWNRYAQAITRASPFPWKLPGTNAKPFEKPHQGDKKCNWWLYAPSNSGKSTWVQKEFEGKAAYMVPKEASGRPYHPWDRYQGEEILIYDDHYPCLSDITQLTGWYTLETEMPGGNRYEVRTIPLKTRLTIIIIYYCDPSWWSNNPAFTNRFNVLNITSLL